MLSRIEFRAALRGQSDQALIRVEGEDSFAETLLPTPPPELWAQLGTKLYSLRECSEPASLTNLCFEADLNAVFGFLV
jgi:hypothetical protein